jgi:hypothetical protein
MAFNVCRQLPLLVKKVNFFMRYLSANAGGEKIKTTSFRGGLDLTLWLWLILFIVLKQAYRNFAAAFSMSDL